MFDYQPKGSKEAMCLFLFSTLVKVFTWKFDIVPSKRAEYTMLFKAYAQNWKNILLVIKSHGRFVTRSGEIDKRWRNWLHLLVEVTSYMQKKYKGKKLGLSVQHAGEGNGNPLQYSCLENPVDRGTWWAAVHGVAQSRTWLKQLSSSSIATCSISFKHWIN